MPPVRHDRSPSAAHRCPRARAGPDRGRALLRHAHGRVRRRGDQDRAAGQGRRPAPARAHGRRRQLLVRPGQPRQEGDHPRPAHAEGPGDRPAPGADVRRRDRELPPRRARVVGARLGGAERAPPVAHHGAHHGLRPDGPAAPGPGLRRHRLGLRRHVVSERPRRSPAVAADAGLSRLPHRALHRLRRDGGAAPPRRHGGRAVDRRRALRVGVPHPGIHADALRPQGRRARARGHPALRLARWRVPDGRRPLRRLHRAGPAPVRAHVRHAGPARPAQGPALHQPRGPLGEHGGAARHRHGVVRVAELRRGPGEPQIPRRPALADHEHGRHLRRPPLPRAPDHRRRAVRCRAAASAGGHPAPVRHARPHHPRRPAARPPHRRGAGRPPRDVCQRRGSAATAPDGRSEAYSRYVGVRRGRRRSRWASPSL